MKRNVLYSLLILSLSASSAYADWKSSAKQKSFNKLESALNQNLDNTKVSIKTTERNKPEFEILTVRRLLIMRILLLFFKGQLYDMTETERQ